MDNDFIFQPGLTHIYVFYTLVGNLTPPIYSVIQIVSALAMEASFRLLLATIWHTPILFMYLLLSNSLHFNAASCFGLILYSYWSGQ